jgi:GGDEF domain-containing protein
MGNGGFNSMLDLWTVLVASCVAMVIVAGVFFVDRLWMPVLQSTRQWSVTFVAAVTCSAGYLVAGATDDAWWAVVVGNSGMVVVVGTVWTGARAFHDRRPNVLVVVAAALVVALVTIFPLEADHTWMGTTERFVALFVFSVLGFVETRRGRLRGFLAGRVLGAVLLVHAVYVAVRTAAFLLAGPGSAFFETWFSTSVATLVTMMLVMVGASALVAIGIRSRAIELHRADRGGRTRVIRRRDFAARTAASTGTVLAVAIDFAVQLRAAYGAPISNAMALELRRALAAVTPDSSPVVRLDGGACAALLEGLDADEVAEMAEQVWQRFHASRVADDLDLALHVGVVTVPAGCPDALNEAERRLSELEPGTPHHVAYDGIRIP